MTPTLEDISAGATAAVHSAENNLFDKLNPATHYCTLLINGQMGLGTRIRTSRLLSKVFDQTHLAVAIQAFGSTGSGSPFKSRPQIDVTVVLNRSAAQTPRET